MSSILDQVLEATSSGARVISENNDLNSINYGGEAAVNARRPSEPWDAGEYGISLAQAQAQYDAAQTPEAREKVIAELKARALRRASLAVTNGKVNLVVAGTLPWHGLGVLVDKAFNAKQARELAGLNWTVSKTPLFYTDKTGTQRQSQSAWSIVRDDTGVEFGTVGSKYQPIQNDAATDFLDEVVGEFGAKFESAGALFDGEKIFFLINLPKQAFTINGGDRQEPYALLENPHDGSGAAYIYPTVVRVVCNNTFRTATRERHKGLRISHTGNIKSKIESARRALALSVEGIETYKEQAEALYAKPLEIKNYANDVLDAVLDVTAAEALKGADALAAALKVTEAQRELERKSIANKIERRSDILNDILERYEGERCGIGSIRGTAWSAFNAITEHADFNKIGRQAQNERVRQSRRFESVIAGDADELKQVAFELALKA